MTPEQHLQASLGRGLPAPFADCIAERTFDALSPAERAEFWTRASQHPPDTLPPPARTLQEARQDLTRDVPPAAVDRVLRATRRCRVHDRRLDGDIR